jgi:hypothetical protein
LHAESAEPAAPSGENLISVLPHHQNAWSVRGESRIKEIKRKGQSKEKKEEKIATKRQKKHNEKDHRITASVQSRRHQLS